MKRFKINSLQKRLVIFLLIPVALLLIAGGFAGFIFARGTMLDAWREASILKLQRAAHHIDMRFNKPIEWIEMFHRTGGYGNKFASPDWILEQLKQLDGIAMVDLRWADERFEMIPMRGGGSMSGMGMRRFHRAKISKVTSPLYDAQIGQNTVSLISNLKDESDQIIGTLEVAIRFDYLMQDILTLGWWQSNLAYLADDSGRYLART